MTTSILFLIVGCALGAIAALFVQMQKSATERLNAERNKIELETLQKQKEEDARRYTKLNEEHRRLSAENTSLQMELASLKTELQKEQELREGRPFHVIISSLEHNSVFRPVHELTKRGLSYSIAEVSALPRFQLMIP